MVIHTRTFLDHNRPWVDVKDEAAANAIQSASTGAYGWRGRAIPNNQVEQNLREHFKAWADALKSVGQKDLIVVELHTIDPEKAVQNFGKSLDVPYSLSHAFSDQFIIEKSIYLNAVQYAGFHNDQDPSHHQYFPNKEGLSTVSINYFTVGDKAQTSIIRPNLTGGIDLNPSLGYVTIIRDSNGEPVPMNFPQIQNINMLGLQPILLKIVAFNGRVLEK